VVWPYERGLVLSTLHYADELVPQSSFAELSLSGPRPVQGEVEKSVPSTIAPHNAHKCPRPESLRGWYPCEL